MPHPIDAPALSISRALGIAWGLALVAVPTMVWLAAPIANNLGLPSDCGFDQGMGAIVALVLAIPSGVVMTLLVFGVYAVGWTHRGWIVALLTLYAVATTAGFVAMSDWCT